MPSVVIVTEPFEQLARMTAASLGVESFPILVVAHPIYTRDDSWIRSTGIRLAELMRAGAVATVA